VTGPANLTLDDGQRQLGLSDTELWTRYLALGGNNPLHRLREHVHSNSCPDPHEHNIIAQALNDTYVDRGHDHPVAYRHLYQLP
jgi:hypothetical protein